MAERYADGPGQKPRRTWQEVGCHHPSCEKVMCESPARRETNGRIKVSSDAKCWNRSGPVSKCHLARHPVSGSVLSPAPIVRSHFPAGVIELKNVKKMKSDGGGSGLKWGRKQGVNVCGIRFNLPQTTRELAGNSSLLVLLGRLPIHLPTSFRIYIKRVK